MGLIGDGGEDISCRLEPGHLNISEDCDGSFPSEYVDTFLNELKCFHLEGLVFPRTHMNSRYESVRTTFNSCFDVQLQSLPMKQRAEIHDDK